MNQCKNAHGLLHGFVPLHLEAVAVSVQSFMSRMKKRLTTKARPLGNKLACGLLHKSSSNKLWNHKIANHHWKGRNECRRSVFIWSEAVSVSWLTQNFREIYIKKLKQSNLLLLIIIMYFTIDWMNFPFFFSLFFQIGLKHAWMVYLVLSYVLCTFGCTLYFHFWKYKV